MRGASPSKGMLKRMFEPAEITKKKDRTALGMSKKGGPDIQKTNVGFGRKK